MYILYMYIYICIILKNPFQSIFTSSENTDTINKVATYIPAFLLHKGMLMNTNDQ